LHEVIGPGAIAGEKLREGTQMRKMFNESVLKESHFISSLLCEPVMNLATDCGSGAARNASFCGHLLHRVHNLKMCLFCNTGNVPRRAAFFFKGMGNPGCRGRADPLCGKTVMMSLASPLPQCAMAQSDIARAANELIELYGTDAAFVAAHRANDLRAIGGDEYARWKSIMMAILAQRAACKAKGKAHSSIVRRGGYRRSRCARP
jgi:hypothetical protein